MLTVSGQATAYRQMSNQEPERLGGSEVALLTPAERIALTIALLNHGLDLIHGVTRTPFAEWRRGRFGIVTTLSRSTPLAERPHSHSVSSRISQREDGAHRSA
jgi:hypothetical protein